VELVGLESSSSMDSFASSRSIATEWRRKKDDWRSSLQGEDESRTSSPP